MILFGLIALLSQGAAASDYYPHEIRKVMTDHFGYQEAWVKIPSPYAEKGTNELPLELSVPFCNSKSVHQLDQFCVLKDGTVAKVTAIKGREVAVELVDVSTSPAFYAFVNKARSGSGLRMPASSPEKEIVCEASCPQMDSVNPCQATGNTKEKAYRELASLMKEKPDTDCKLCNLKAVVCDGEVYQTVDLNKRH